MSDPAKCGRTLLDRGISQNQTVKIPSITGGDQRLPNQSLRIRVHRQIDIHS